MRRFADNLRKTRQSLGLKQREVAEYLGISRSTYAKYEIAQSEPSLELLCRLCDHLHVSADMLLGQEELKKR